MTQQSSHSCPNCGFSVASGQRFCSNCGAVQEVNANTFTERTPSGADIAPSYEQAQHDNSSATEIYPQTPPPPPPPSSYPESPQAPHTQYEQGYAPMPAYQPAPSLPSYATPQKDSSKSVLRQMGCGVGIVLLLVLVVCGTLGYFVYNGIRNAASTTSKSLSTTGSNGVGNTNPDATPTQGSITTSPVNATVTYASVTMIIVDVKQAQTFLDDTNSSQNGVLRVDIREQGPTQGRASFLYADVLRLQLPDGTKVAPSNAKEAISLEPSTSRDNWFDFPVPTNVKASQTALQLGTDTEAQMVVALTSNPDVSKYQAKTVQVNKQTQYDSLNWTITSTTTSLSTYGKQANKGMVYMTVSFKIDNPSQHDFNRYWGDYIRRKGGDTTSSPEVTGTDLPLDFPIGSTGKTGSVVFLLPDNVSSYTLILLGDTGSQISQSTLSF